MALDLNITTQEEIMQPVTVAMTPKTRGVYLDFDGVAMHIIVDFYDQNSKMTHSKEIVVQGAFYAQSNSALAPQVLAAIQQGAATILTSPSPVQSFIDSGDIIIKEYLNSPGGVRDVVIAF